MITQGKKLAHGIKKYLRKSSGYKFKKMSFRQCYKRIKFKKYKLNITAVYTSKQTEKILKVINKKRE